MSLDLTDLETARVPSTPLIAAVAEDDLAARRIESVLESDGTLVRWRGLSIEEYGRGAAAGDPDVLVVACGRGITCTETSSPTRRAAAAPASVAALTAATSPSTMAVT